MARTAPVPDIPPIPGMCPSIAVLAGGGDGGGGSGEGAGDGSGDNNAGGSGSGEGAEGDQRGAPDYDKYPKCGYASHPVDVVTGRAFTHPLVDISLPGPLPLTFKRMYSSKASTRDMGLGPGWAHTFGWEIEVQRRRITVWNEQGIAVDFPVIPVGGETLGPWGWVLRRETWGFAVDADDGVWHMFSAGDEAGKKFRLTAIQDRNKNRIALTYEDNRLVEIVDSAGRTIRVLSTKEGRIASFQAKNAVSDARWIAFASYSYDDRGRLIGVTDADGYSANYAYDDDNRLTDDTDRAGLAFHFRYDNENRCIESWGDYPGRRDPSLAEDVPKYLADGVTRVKGIHHCKFEYFPEGYSEVADSTQVRRFFGTIHGTLSKAVEGGAVTTASYRDDGHLLSETDPLGATTSYDRDARGRVLKTIDPLGRTTVITRDVAGLPVEIVDAAGGISLIDRDRFGNVTLFTDPVGSVRGYSYDARGLLTAIVEPNGAKTALEYDAQGNLTTITQPNGGVFRYTYDALGRRLSETDPLGASTRYSYTNRGDIAGRHDAVGGVTRYSFDGEGHLTQIVDAGGGTTQFIWGGYNKLCIRIDANQHELRLVYSNEGELVEMRNERGQVHRIERDPSGRPVAETTFDGRIISYRNDRLGRPIQIKSNSGEATILTYDLAGQLISRERADGSADIFEYSPRGEIVAAIGPLAQIRFERDAVGRVIREIQGLGDEEDIVDITYDGMGDRVTRTTSRGHHESIARDAMGVRVETVLGGSVAVRRTLDVLGREVGRDLPRGGRIESAYDALGHLGRRRALEPMLHASVGRSEPEWIGQRAGNVAAETSYGYGWNQELVDTWDSRGGHTQYQYDPIGQLVARLPEKARSELFQFDPTGNLHEAGAAAPKREYDTGNRLLRKGDAEYRWNDDGRLVEKSVRAPGAEKAEQWSYAWDAAGLLSSVKAPDGRLIEFAYDAFARRVQKRVSRPSATGQKPIPVSQTRFVWDGNVLVHEIKTTARAAGDPVIEERTYCFADEGHGFEPVAHRDISRAGDEKTEGEWFHYVNDPVGAPVRLLDATGTVACELDRTAWGTTEAAPESRTTTPIRFPGQYEDEETGLFYNRHRYYDPDASRFISADPIESEGGANAFAYVPNPTEWIDPLGELFSATTVQLGTSMQGIGLPFVEGQTPHHIVQQGSPGAAGAAILTANGLGVHSGENGARLWGTHPAQVARPAHPGRGCAGYHAGSDIHGAAAQAKVAAELKAAETAGGGPGTPGARAAIVAQLAVIRNRYETGVPGTR